MEEITRLVITLVIIQIKVQVQQIIILLGYLVKNAIKLMNLLPNFVKIAVPLRIITVDFVVVKIMLGINFVAIVVKI